MMRSAKKEKPKPNLIFSAVAEDAVKEILDREFVGKDGGEVDSDLGDKREKFGKHLKMMSAHLKHTFGDALFYQTPLSNNERILVMDIVNHAINLGDKPADAADSVFIEYAESKNQFLKFVCEAAMGRDDFVSEFMGKKEIGLSDEAERDYYKDFFKRSSKELIAGLTKNYIIDNKDFYRSLVVYDSQAGGIEHGLEGDNFIKSHSTVCSLYKDSLASQFSSKATVDDQRDVSRVEEVGKEDGSKESEMRGSTFAERYPSNKVPGAKSVSFHGL